MGRPGRAAVFARIHPADLPMLKRVCAQSGESLSTFVRTAINDALEDQGLSLRPLPELKVGRPRKEDHDAEKD